MGRFTVIGLGNFGSNVAKVLFELGHEVICLDINENLIRSAQKNSTYSLVGQATDMSVLSSLQVKNMDAVFVSLGEDISASVLVILHLRDLGAKRIIGKIVSEDHGRILMKVGAHEVVFPERDMAVRTANEVSSPSIMNYLDLSPEYAIQEIAPSDGFTGKTLAETRIRQEFGVNVIGIKDVIGDRITLNPEANYLIKDSDVLIVIGRRDDLGRLAKKK
ncbi:MAG: TrkA family potassium uptake protein [Pseudomonadota bacterium]